MTKENVYKPLEFQEKADGIPVIVSVKQPDGEVKTINLFFATNDQSLIELTEKAQHVNDKTKEIAKKYPVLEKELSDIDDEDFEANQQLIKGLAEAVELNYDDMFGKGTYKKLSDAGLGIKTLLPRMETFSSAIVEQLNAESEETRKQSAKKKGEALIKKKKKQK